MDIPSALKAMQTATMAPLLLYFQIAYSWLKHVTNGALSTGPFLQLLPAVPFLTYSVTPARGNKMDAEGSLYTMSAQQHQRYWLMDGLRKEAVGKLRIRMDLRKKP